VDQQNETRKHLKFQRPVAYLKPPFGQVWGGHRRRTECGSGKRRKASHAIVQSGAITYVMEGKREKQNRTMGYHNPRRERKPKKQARTALRMDDFGYGRTDRNYYRGRIVNVGRTAPHCQQEACEQTAQSRRTLNRGLTWEAAGPLEICGCLFSRLSKYLVAIAERGPGQAVDQHGGRKKRFATRFARREKRIEKPKKSGGKAGHFIIPKRFPLRYLFHN
jgi:hypothetical protein